MGNLFLSPYVSGFLGLALPHELTEHRKVDLGRMANGMVVTLRDTGSVPGTYSERIDSLMDQLIIKPVVLNRFEYQHEVLEELLALFGTDDFMEWIKIQSTSPYFDKLHKDYLEDTLSYIHTGVRKMSPTGWMGRFSHRQFEYRAVKPKVSTVVRCDIDLRSYEKDGSLRNMGAVIQTWLSNEGGFFDLISFAWLVFGSGGAKQGERS